MEPLGSRIFIFVRGLFYSAAFVSLWTVIALAVLPLDDRLSFQLPDWLSPIGVGIAAGGALLAGSSILTFLTAGRGTPAPFDPPRTFVAIGPYRWVRNPMYVGATFSMLGAALAFASPFVLGLALGFVLLMHLFVVVHEEPALERRFGASYVAYKAEVDRWIPKRPRVVDSEMTIRGLLLRYFGIYVGLFLVLASVSLGLGWKPDSTWNGVFLVCAVIGSSMAFGSRNRRKFTSVEMARMIWGMLLLDLGLQFAFLLPYALAKERFKPGDIASMLAFVGVIHGALLWGMVAIANGLLAKRFPTGEPAPRIPA